MAIDNRFMARKIQNMEQLFAVYSAATGMPYVTCDEESGNDQVWIFASEEDLQAFAKPYTEKKTPLRGVQLKNNNYLKFFGSLFTIGINELVYVEGGTDFHMPLTDLVRQPDYSSLPKERQPLLNPTLQLTGLYFMQEASRAVPADQKEGLKDLEEELSANLIKSRFLLPIEPGEGDEPLAQKLKNNNYKLPMLKDKTGNVLQPLLTDALEFEKFAKGKQLNAIVIPFNQLSKLLTKDAKGFLLNPQGFHLMLTRELLNALPGRFQ